MESSSSAVNPNRMKRIESHSWWWDSHICPNSKCLQENLQEMDQRVKQMLKLIEEDGDSFAKKAEMYYQKRPELIRLVEDFYRRYRSLAERYDNVAGELRKAQPPELQSQGSGISEYGSEPPSTMPSPERKPNRRKSGHRAPGFEFFLGEGYESSTLDSESESDDFFGKFEERGLRQKVIELEGELHDVKEKLEVSEDKMGKYEEEINYWKMELERYKSLGDTDDVLSGGVVNPDDPVVLDCGGEVLDSSHRIQTLEEELRITREKVQENEQLQDEISRLEKERAYMEVRLKGLNVRCHDLEDELRRVKYGRAERESQAENESMDGEIQGKSENVPHEYQELKEKLDALQVKYYELVSEKDELNTSISELEQDASFKDDQIDQMNNHLNQLHTEHIALIDRAEEARKLVDELRSKIKELEREVEKKQEMIVLGAEEKREAIRQLCFSLEHYRNGYHRLREVLTEQKPPVEATQVVM